MGVIIGGKGTWKVWRYVTPGMVYAGELDCGRAMGERGARARLREAWGCDRLPQGTELWPGPRAYRYQQGHHGRGA